MANYRVCGCFTRKYKLESLDPPVEVKEIFDRYSEGGRMSVKNLQMFLQECQGTPSATENDAEITMDRLRQKRLTNAFQHHKHTLNLEGFFRFLFCDDLNNAIQSQVHHDMTAPLSDYYIYTGHNSYLTGNQLSSDCSDLPIIKALDRGVRVIELDIWPNGDKDDVLVLHGRTLTSPVALIKCLRSIKHHAFHSSEYPLIITLEDHLNRDLQAKTAKMITETFGELLYFPDKEDGLEVFPSPESLKNHIIISTKPPKEYLERKDSNVSDKQEKDRQKESEESAWGDEFDYRKADMQKSDSGMGEDDVSDNDDGDEDDDEENSFSSNKTAAPEYKRIITIRAGKPKGSIRDALKVDEKHVKRVSLSEPQLEKIANSHPKDVVRFTQKNLLRIYPKGTRVTSTNYNPLIAWTHGAQMVALNMQGYGRSLWLMHGFFRANGGCGYVKKPDFLLAKNGGHDVFNPKAPRPLKTTLKVKVYMGEGWNQEFKKTHFDMYSPPDFYTRIGIAGVPADMVMRKTKTIEDNWMPHWNEEFSFPLTIPELALLRVEVHEYDMSEKDDFAGQTCLPVSELRTGIRVLPLYDRKGEKYNNVKLLVRIEFISH